MLLAFTACTDLEETVYSDLTVEGYSYQAENINNLIIPVYSNLRNVYGWVGGVPQNELATDMLVMPNGGGWSEPDLKHPHTWTADEAWGGMWNSSYSGIIHANRIIGQLESKAVPIPGGETYEAYMAEMKVARAFYYWLLMDTYGDVPYVTAASQDLPARTPRATVFENLVAEINSVMDDLSPDVNTKMYGRFNKWAAKQLLANLYLNADVYTGTAQWDKCISECSDIINSGKFTLEDNYADCFSVDNYTSTEAVFSMPLNPTYGGSMLLYVTLHPSSSAKYNIGPTAWGLGGVKGVPQFTALYDVDDSRSIDTWEQGPQFDDDGVTPLLCVAEKAGEQLDYTADIKRYTNALENEGWRVTKWRPELGASDLRLENDFFLFRYTQVLMMKAECLLRTGQADAAAAIVTEARQRAFKSNPAKATITGAELTGDSKYPWGYYAEDYAFTNGTLQKGAADLTPVQYGGMYDELGREFACELMRRRDMIRFGTWNTKSWFGHQPSTADQSGASKVFPIPQSAMNSNPNLVQNPGY